MLSNLGCHSLFLDAQNAPKNTNGTGKSCTWEKCSVSVFLEYFMASFYYTLLDLLYHLFTFYRTSMLQAYLGKCSLTQTGYNSETDNLNFSHAKSFWNHSYQLNECLWDCTRSILIKILAHVKPRAYGSLTVYILCILNALWACVGKTPLSLSGNRQTDIRQYGHNNGVCNSPLWRSLQMSQMMEKNIYLCISWSWHSVPFCIINLTQQNKASITLSSWRQSCLTRGKESDYCNQSLQMSISQWWKWFEPVLNEEERKLVMASLLYQ